MQASALVRSADGSVQAEYEGLEPSRQSPEQGNHEKVQEAVLQVAVSSRAKNPPPETQVSQRGDRVAFGHLIDRHYQGLYRLAYQCLGSHLNADARPS